MQKKEHHIFLVSFERDTLKSVFDCIRATFSDLDTLKMPVDFVLDGLVSSNSESEFVVNVKRRDDSRTCSLYYYALDTEGMAAKNDILDALGQNSVELQRGCIIYCFDAENLQNGFGPFDHPGETEYVKFTQTAYFLSHQDIRSYNLIYFSATRGFALGAAFKDKTLSNNMYIDGKKLSMLVNGNERYLEQYHYFLELPTYIILNSEIIPKIPF